MAEFGWGAGLGLSKSRRSSVLPQALPGQKAARKRLTKAQRLAYKQFIRDMVMHFAEVRRVAPLRAFAACCSDRDENPLSALQVDAFELLEESPQAKQPGETAADPDEHGAPVRRDLAASDSDEETGTSRSGRNCVEPVATSALSTGSCPWLA